VFDYRQSFKLGHSYAQLVADRLNFAGVNAELQPLEFAVNEQDRERFTKHEKDIITPAGVIEVKSSTRTFNDNPKQYPNPTLIVDTQSGFDRKARPPVAYCMVSQTTRAIVVVPVSSQPRWYVKELYDQHREHYDLFYVVRRDELRTFDQLVWWLLDKAHNTLTQ
jgi:hypothetical protein